jgi:formylglycine-generating enzyme required for sulfatase activity
MGSREIDKPEHRVTVAPYCIDKTEVTVAAFRACVQAHKCRPPSATVEWKGLRPDEKAKWSQFCTWGQRGLDRHPMTCVDWNQATAYCASTGGRLPTEAEWEYAARGNDRRNFPWGNQLPDVTRLNACGSECASMAKERFDETWRTMYKGDDGWPATAPVGSYPKGASPFGVLDMAGNVWEWTADTYVAPGEESGMNPQKPAAESPFRAIRGGSWNGNVPDRIHPAYADGNDAAGRNFSLGFRCARAAKM